MSFAGELILLVLLWSALLLWWGRMSKPSAEWLAGSRVLVIDQAPLVTRLVLSSWDPPDTVQETSAPRDEEPSVFLHKPPRLPQTQREVLHRAGFTSTQIEGFLLLRQAYRARHDHPDPGAPARLHFARWLYQHGKISG